MGTEKHGDGKLSESLLAFAQPLLEQLGLDGAAEPGEHFEAGLRIAQTLWNAEVLTRSGRGPHALEQLFQALEREGLPAPLRSLLTAMVAQRRTSGSLDSRVLLSVEVVRDPQAAPRVRVSGAPLEALEARELVEGFARLGQRSARTSKGRGAAAPKASRARAATAGKSLYPVDATAGEVTRSPGQEPWRSLYSTAKRLHAFAPWDWLLDHDVFGVRIAGESETYWCSVMGAGGEFYGVGLYRGDSAFAVYRVIQSGADRDVGIYGFDGFLFSFVDRQVLSAVELQRVKSCGVKFRGRSAWPQFEQVVYGRLPRTIDAELAPLALDLLELVLLGAAHMRSLDPHGQGDSQGELPVLQLEAGSPVLSWDRPRPVAGPRFPAVDQIALERLRAKAQRVDATFEFDACAMPARVRAEDAWEYAPTVFLAADARTGVALNPSVDPPELRFETCARRALGMFETAGVIPRKLHVARGWVLEALAPTASALGIEIVLRDRLPAIERLRDSFARGTGF